MWKGAPVAPLTMGWRMMMSKVMTKGCTCNELDDDLKDEGWTCYACYEGDNE
jgi:hypothetical protein